ncbi:MAG: hypothetical protein JWN58_1656 [Gammaproteobacteria bacterium]|nr:hypothetical protein [Gammaproteobacteria bacterium]
MAYQRVFGRRSGFQPPYAREKQIPRQVDFIELVSRLASPDAMDIARPSPDREIPGEERESLFASVIALAQKVATFFPSRQTKAEPELVAEADPEPNPDLREPT